MMTLRELINHVMNRGASLHVYACICDTYYGGKDIMGVSHTFTAVIRELLETEASTDSMITKDHFLMLNSVIADGEECVEVVLKDTVDDSIYAVDFVQWSDLIDLLVQDNTGLSLELQLAHVLYEITFWGWTAEQIKQEKLKLDEARAEPMPLSGIDDLFD